MKKVWVSAILSFIFPGLGHLYLGRVLKGLFFVIVNIVSILYCKKCDKRVVFDEKSMGFSYFVIYFSRLRTFISR
ncbi:MULTISPECIES: DUF6677 family protein [Geobacillus]|uniref:DUF6677 domain-containing protein n=1 Tax=Geobacillus icigianus TaxID=1430331 RepID=A0ABU6BGW3_9BACL|nr:DUF6677 family protein [Geobacillus icigianus]MEB3751182.1 hypothetical protein [Geobacillus icigianus]